MSNKNLNKIYYDIFGKKTDGFFVEVGAFDGLSWSNTNCLVKNNWSGIYIEPVKRYYEKLKQNLSQYKNLKFINCGWYKRRYQWNKCHGQLFPK